MRPRNGDDTIFLRFNPFRDTVIGDMCEEIADITNIPGPMKFILVLSERMEELGLEAAVPDVLARG